MRGNSPSQPSSTHRGGDRHDFGDGHPVQAVHEVDEVDKPEPGQQQQAAFDPERAGRNDPQIVRRRKNDGGDGEPLQHQPRQHRNGFDVIGKADDGDEQRRARKPRPGFSGPPRRRTAMTAPATISVAAITAMPAPCGVGMRCEERALGVASACRNISGRIAQVMTADSSAASKRGNKRQGQFGNGSFYACRCED